MRTNACPTVSCRREAPITATERGLKNDSMDADSARCSRLLITPIAVSVAAIGNSRLTTPSSNPLTRR